MASWKISVDEIDEVTWRPIGDLAFRCNHLRARNAAFASRGQPERHGLRGLDCFRKCKQTENIKEQHCARHREPIAKQRVEETQAVKGPADRNILPHALEDQSQIGGRRMLRPYRAWRRQGKAIARAPRGPVSRSNSMSGFRAV